MAFLGFSLAALMGLSLGLLGGGGSFNASVGFAGYLGHVEVPWAPLGVFTAIAAAGILVGTWASHFVSQAALKRAFSIFLTLMGLFILYENHDAFTAPPEPSGPTSQRSG